MAGVTYTEDRETFERQLFRPPHAARMTEHAGRFVERLDRDDKDALLKDALDWFWEHRGLIQETQDILRTWVKALEHAAGRRPVWRTWFNVYESRLVKGSKLGRQL